jgi:hypothetical protein
MQRPTLAACASVLAAAALLTNHASATPLRLDYKVTALGGGVYRYDFTFVNDNNDGTWAAGQSFRWFVLGDVVPGPSPLTNFIGDPNSFQNSPYTGFGNTSGGHNGPDLQPVLTDWVPTSVGDSFSFSGTSTANLGQGALRWSNVITGSTGTGVRGNFEIARLLCFCQEDIGFQGPGPARLTVCGGDLSTGTTSLLEVTGARPSAPAYLVADLVHTPFPIFGGTLVGFAGFPVTVNGSGGLTVVVPGGGGPSDVYTQLIYLDFSIGQGLGFTNGVRIRVLP